jgi:uncharacterized protein DUF1360
MEQPPHWVTLVLIALATYRLTRLITRDAFPLIAVPRDWIQTKWDPFDDEGWENYARYSDNELRLLVESLRTRGIPRPTQWKRSIAYLVTCPWCVSIWVGAAVSVLSVAPLHLITWTWSPFVWLAASALTGLIAQREKMEDQK